MGPPSRFEVIANYSFVWHMRTQPPADHGTADISTIHHLTLGPDEVATVKLDEKEYKDARWFLAEEVLAGEFHPALKQAIRDLRARKAYVSLETAVAMGADDSQVAQLARDLVARGAASLETPVKVRFDAASAKYSYVT